MSATTKAQKNWPERGGLKVELEGELNHARPWKKNLSRTTGPPTVSPNWSR
jgi:hypothetical protein